MSGFKSKITSCSKSDKQAMDSVKKCKESVDIKIPILQKEIEQLKISEQKNKRVKDALQKKTHALAERIKELNCLYAISNLVEKYPISLDKILCGIVDIIPSAWQYPQITCAKISVDQQIYKTANYTETPWKQSSGIFVHGKMEGSLEVCYVEEQPECDEGPFLKEERNLLNAVAKHIGEIIERKNLEKEVLEISEREQQRIGQDLHDSLCQQLTGIAFLGKVLQQKLNKKSFEETQEAGEIVSLINEAITETKIIARGLYPIRLGADGLMPALSELSKNMEKMFNIECIVKYNKPLLLYDNFVAIHIYRIIQEAANNAVKHGKATKILIEFTENNELSILTIKDNGKTINVHDIAREGPGMGTIIMKHRANMIGASLDMQNRPEGGITVTCTFKNKERRKGRKGSDEKETE